MKIVYINPEGRLGGAERSLLDVLAAVRQSGFDARLHLICFLDGPLLRRAAQLGVAVWLLPVPRCLWTMGDSVVGSSGDRAGKARLALRGASAAVAAGFYAARLARLLERLRPGLVHSNGIKAHLLARIAKPAGRPLLWHVRDFITERPIAGTMLRWAAAGTAGAIAISRSVADDTRSICRRLTVRVIYNVVDDEEFSPGLADGRWLDELAGLPAAAPGTVRVGMVATYARWKGQERFIEAAARLIRRRLAVPVRFYIVGGPIYRTAGSQYSEAELHSLAQQCGVADRLGLIGFQDRPADVYRSLDVVVHASSRPEPFGRTIAEAMACGRPVIVASRAGAVELLSDREVTLVTSGHTGELAEAMIRLVERPELRARMGEAARRAAVAKFSRRRLGTEMVACYRQLCRGRSLVRGLASSKPARAGSLLLACGTQGVSP